MGVHLYFDDVELANIQAARSDLLWGQNTNSSMLLKKIDNVMHASTEMERIFEDKNIEHTMIEDPDPLWGGAFFNKGESIILAAEHGCGKSLLSIDIARSPKVKKALFITLEDYSRLQLPRYIMGLKPEQYDLVSCKTWKYLRSQVTQNLENKVDLRILQENLFVSYAVIQNRRETLQRRYGIKDTEYLDNFLLFETLMKGISDMGFDFICLDSLNAFCGYNKLTRERLERLIEIPMAYGMTFLIVHHTNKVGEISGTSEIVNAMDSAYILEEDKAASEKDENTAVLDLREVKARHKGANQRVRILRKRISTFEFTLKPGDPELYVDSNDKTKSNNLGETILALLGDAEDGKMKKIDLLDKLHDAGYNTSGSISNALTELEKKSKILKADGKSWDSIQLKNREEA